MPTTSAPSPEYQRFLHSLEEPVGRSNVDSFDRRALLSLAGAEKTAAEDLLIGMLARPADARVARALVDLGTTRAVPALRDALSRASADLVRVALAQALHRLAGDTTGVDVLVQVLRGSKSWSARSSAAVVLARFPGDAAEQALLAAIDDAEPTVRANAFAALLDRHHLTQLTSSYLDALGMLAIRLRSELRSIQHAASAQLRRLLEDLRRGRTPAELGLDYVAPEDAPWCARLVDSLSEDNASLALDALDQVAGRDREWAEDLVMSRLPDPRASAALGHMHARRALDALRELATGGEGGEASAAARAIREIEAAAHGARGSL